MKNGIQWSLDKFPAWGARKVGNLSKWEFIEVGIYRVRDIYFAGRKWPLDRKKLLIIDQNNKIIK
jgi:hypothetical protein